MSSPIQHLDHLKIPLKDILVATNNFSDENFIRQGGFGKIYKGKLKRSGKLIDIVARRLDTFYGQGSKHFWTEISMLSKLKHENLVSLVGFCDEKNVKIVINKHVAKGSLDNFITDPNFTWGRRLYACAYTARALSYIHYDENRDFSVIHRNLKSSKILLNDICTPMLSGFNLSMATVASRRGRLCIDDPCGSAGYVDPTYAKTGTVTHKSDIYSFGVILFEVLFGMKAITDNRDIKLAQQAKSRYENEQLDDWINPHLRKQMAGESLKIFSKTAYDCLNEHRAGRPNIHQVVMKLENALRIQQLQASKVTDRQSLNGAIILDVREFEERCPYLEGENLEHLNFEVSERGWAKDNFADRYLQESQEVKNNQQISLAEIKMATQDFSRDNLIGKGGFGQVYRGKLLGAHGHKNIAVKRLDKTSDQGETELLTEVEILSEYKHMNVIDLVSYCNENGEKVIVYDYASKGSLDRWLKHKELTWRKRIEICIDIATGLDFLHGTSDVKQEVVIHRDIKSANILLHDDWKASINDFGLSLISPINQDTNFVIDNVKGTRGYCDPQYINDGFLTKESDIYSFGVLLFEMLCGRFVIEHNSSGAQNLVHLVRQHVEEGTLHEMVFEATKKQMAVKSMIIFQNIAYQCIHEERSKRPTACDVLIQLKRALECQLFSFGAIEGRVEMISATKFQYESYYRPNKWRTLSKSRFGEVVQISDSSSMNIEISVMHRCLSPGVYYGVYLVYKFCRPIDESTTRTHKLAIKMGSRDLFRKFTTRKDNDGWMRIELYRFLNLKEEANYFDAFLMGFSEDPFKNVAIYVEGVEFQPISHMMTHEEIEELKKVNV